MKKIWLVILVAILTNYNASIAKNVEVNASFEVLSAYVFKGATYNDGLVLQPSVEVSSSPITIGTWVNYDIGDYNDTLKKNEVSEVDFYVSYDLPYCLTAGYCIFTYPHYDCEVDQEISLALELEDVFLSPYIIVEHGVDGAIAKGFHYEAGISYNFEIKDFKFPVGALISYCDHKGEKSGFAYYELSFVKSINVKDFDIGFSATYIGLIDNEVLPRSTEGGGYDVDFVGKFFVNRSF